MNGLKKEIEKLSKDIDYKEKSKKFLEMNRWIGKDPVLMVIETAATSTGQDYFNIVKPEVRRFKRKFIDSGKVENLKDLSNLDIENPEFKEVFPNKRKRKVSVKIAKKLVGMRNSGDDLEVFKKWARRADPYHYETDPIGEIKGIKLRTFQYLRMNAGVDTIKPDRQVQKFLDLLEGKLNDSKINTSNDKKTLKSCEWICKKTGLRMIDLDQIAWWYFSGDH